MTKEYSYRGLAWVDLENPTEDEINTVMSKFDIPIEAGEDLFSPTPKQRVMRFSKCVYVVLHFPTLSFHKNAKQGDDHRKEIDFIVGKNFLVTAHYDSMTALNKFSESLSGSTGDGKEEAHAGVIFHKLVKHLYHSLLHDVESVNESLHNAESLIFKGEEKKMVIELSNIHRDILRFGNALAPHRDAIESLSGIFASFLGTEAEEFMGDIKSEYIRVDRKMQNNKALLEELRHTNDSLLSAKQNEAIKGLTMMAFITFPLTLIATIFSMDAKYMPIVGMPNDFWIIICILLGVMLVCIGFLSYKKWL